MVATMPTICSQALTSVVLLLMLVDVNGLVPMETVSTSSAATILHKSATSRQTIQTSYQTISIQ